MKKRADQIEVTDVLLVGPNKHEEQVERVEHDGDTVVITTRWAPRDPWLVHASRMFEVK